VRAWGALALAALALAGAPVARDAAAAKPPARAVPPPGDSAAVMAMLQGVTNGACPLPGVATGGQPSEKHLRSLARAGYHTVLDMRMPDEPRGYDEAAATRAAGLRYVTIPVTSEAFDDSLFAKFRATMREATPRGVFVHCASGNRVGAAMIPWLVLDRGWDLERAVATVRAAGLRNAEIERRARDYVARQRTTR
jgi:protein tyrosine phosphatase (PTP) superfamily phosphohydrolase (DUF442 family)